ncbi:flagellar export chaperone FliS [Pleionea mediterranea]|jgi:flagellar protein FliS|uniref:Flagellar secretion chaperone FliS n=1 Tax=Pleionea mediterranea TaxID=523701 RepID=A0A316G443_9GAMM|nr:flagellar export chaperone FliS [Pleionea mediterranea]PWK49177.1 flagellar protein FliS [Pleionea mediterranea]
MSLRGLNAYQKTSTQSGVIDANPHRLIQMLMEGALEKMSKAKGFIDRKEYDKKSHHISWAIKIINGLRDSLDADAGGDLSNNLDDLYEYAIHNLITANQTNNIENVDSAISVIKNIKEGWDGIEDEAKKIFSSNQKTAAV